MPEHATWFNFILPHFAELQAVFRSKMGLSLLNKTPVEIQYVIAFIWVAILILILVAIVRPKYAKDSEALIPEGRLTLSTFFETLIDGTISTMEGIMERKAVLYFLPLVGTCAVIILFSNLIGLVPGFLPPTSNLNTTLAMALVVFATTHVFGVKEHGLIGYFAHWFGPIRKWYALPLMLLMFAIEVISHLARPVSLSIRLMGNMFADHMVVATFTFLVPILVPVPMMVMGVLVCIVQTLVFCVLATVYISGAIAHEEH